MALVMPFNFLVPVKLFRPVCVKISVMTIQSEKEQQFLAIIDQNRGLISKVCYMYAVDDDHFKDLYQETLINLWRGMESFRGDSAISTWIYRTSINTCLTVYRRNKHHRSNTSIDAISDIADATPDRTAQLKEMYRLISQLERLDKAIIMMWLDEKTYDEIAEITGLARNNVATRLRRIKAKLVTASQQ